MHTLPGKPLYVKELPKTRYFEKAYIFTSLLLLPLFFGV